MTAFEELEREYDQYYTDDPEKWSHAGHDAEVFKIVQPYGPPRSLIDIGCGNGHTLAHFRANWPEVEYAGLDPSGVALELARRKLPGTLFFHGTVEKCQMTGFEMALVVGVAEHFADVVTGLIGVRKWLKPGGIAYVEVPNCSAYPTSEQVEGFRRLNQGSRQKEWHLYRETWEELIQISGLVIRESVVGSSVYNEFIWILERRKTED